MAYNEQTMSLQTMLLKMRQIQCWKAVMRMTVRFPLLSATNNGSTLHLNHRLTGGWDGHKMAISNQAASQMTQTGRVERGYMVQPIHGAGLDLFCQFHPTLLYTLFGSLSSHLCVWESSGSAIPDHRVVIIGYIFTHIRLSYHVNGLRLCPLSSPR